MIIDNGKSCRIADANRSLRSTLRFKCLPPVPCQDGPKSSTLALEIAGVNEHKTWVQDVSETEKTHGFSSGAPLKVSKVDANR